MEKIKRLAKMDLLPAEYRASCDSRTLKAMDTPTDDTDLMLRYARGDARAFDLLYARHKAPLYRYLLRQCRDRALADDVFQDVWGRVIRSRKNYQPRAKFATFLYRIAHNCAIDQFRMRARRHEEHSESVDNTDDFLQAPTTQQPDIQLASAQFRLAFQRALDDLPDEQRAAFLLYEESGLSLEEIAQITGVGIETAKSRMRYAIGKLRKALGSVDTYFSRENATHAALRSSIEE